MVNNNNNNNNNNKNGNNNNNSNNNKCKSQAKGSKNYFSPPWRNDIDTCFQELSLQCLPVSIPINHNFVTLTLLQVVLDKRGRELGF